MKLHANLNQTRYQYAANALRRYGPSVRSGRVFDIGAGEGRMKGLVEPENFLWTGFDIEPKLPEITKWDVTTVCPPNTVGAADFVLLLDVIEHMPNPGLALKNIHDVMETGGLLVLTAPNPRWSRSRVHALLHGNPSCFTEADLMNNGHVFTPWPHVTSKILDDAGFTIEEYVTLDGKTGWPWPPNSLNYPIRWAHAAINKLIEKFDRSACGMSFGLVARARAT